MNDVAMAQAVQNAVKPKFRANTALKSKVVTHYPEHLEREYMRVTNTYMTMLNKLLAEHLPVIRRTIDAEREGMRTDDNNGVMSVISDTFMLIQTKFEKMAGSFGLERKLTNLGKLTRKLSIREWKRVVHHTLGINILEDYYMGEFFSGALNMWTTKNIDLVGNIPKDTLLKMKLAVEEGYMNGSTNTSIGKKIQEIYGMERSRAQFIAQDQIAKLNSDITYAQQKDAGVEEYVWSDSGDGRVRDCHKHLNGTTQRWDDPPEMWYVTKGSGRVMTGRRCHPGQDYICRCVALPKFNLPWEKSE